ncbi:efflux RND transporter permease subunit, partial [Candidatus Omnitrophota bacterium]
MLEKIIGYFSKRHLMTNFLFAAIFIGGVFAWQHTNKEEMPDITFDRVRISVHYPGAPAEDVEYFVTKPVEEAIRGIDGVYRVTSTSSVGTSSVSVELEQFYSNKEEAITEIRNAVLDVKLPDDVIDDPTVRVFKTSKKAIIDIALIHTGVHLMDIESRRKLQKYVFSLENQLLNLSEVNSVNKRGYLQEEIQIKTYPERLRKYDIPFNTVMQEIKNNHVRKPAGTIETAQEPKVTLLSELNSTEKLNNLVIQGGFEGNVIRLGEVADIQNSYKKNTEVLKINGHEGIILNVVKNSGFGILEALEAVQKVAHDFAENNLEGTSIKLILLDDESIDVRNRLSIIGMNAIIGFTLILIALFAFLNIRAGIWVAMGIPFTFCFTMICASLMGYTINNTTLAAVIIVMGMIVDDAIVVAENITRSFQKGIDHAQAVIKGTSYVVLPITASILTTCVAFIPLFFFSGHFGKFVQFIPPIIFLMLGASLIESIFILPGHMNLHLPFLKKVGSDINERRAHWFEKIENMYGRFLEKVLPYKWFIFTGFFLLLLFSAYIGTAHMKFVMFP